MSAKGNILVTGGAGYIGSHACYALLDAGWSPVVLDNLSTGKAELVPSNVDLIVGEVGDEDLVKTLLATKSIKGVMHFAGSIIVSESVDDPLKYYANNVAATQSLLSACVGAGVTPFIFSSTAAVYGNSENRKVSESEPVNPVSPYGRSKLMIEWMLEDTAKASALRYVALRYFNVAGADPDGRTGMCVDNATHLLKVACETAAGRRPFMEIFGDDYDTPDGTCVRDFIHVSDLVDAHVLALEYLMAGNQSRVLNCGYGHGMSVKQLVETVGRISGAPLDARLAARRKGDIAELIADSTELRTALKLVSAVR